MIWWYRWVLSLWRPKHNLQPTFPLVISSMVTGCGGFNTVRGGYQNRVKGDKRNVSQLNRHNNTWPGNVREMSTIDTRLPIPKTFRPGNPYFSMFFHGCLEKPETRIRNRNGNGNRNRNRKRQRQRNRNSNVKGNQYKNRDIIYFKLFQF